MVKHVSRARVSRVSDKSSCQMQLHVSVARPNRYQCGIHCCTMQKSVVQTWDRFLLSHGHVAAYVAAKGHVANVAAAAYFEGHVTAPCYPEEHVTAGPYTGLCNSCGLANERPVTVFVIKGTCDSCLSCDSHVAALDHQKGMWCMLVAVKTTNRHFCEV